MANHPLKIWFHNLGVASIITQLMVVYITSGFLKAAGEKWQNGTAMYVISKVEWFSLPGFREMFTNPFITTIATYAPMFFMIFFPIAIFSRFKYLWIGTGFFFHLGIAYSMGLVTFSTVMIGLELFLISDPEYESLRRYWLAGIRSLTYSRLLQKLVPKWRNAVPFKK